jgi:hypothetical protein
MKRPMTSQGRRPNRHNSRYEQELKPENTEDIIGSSKMTMIQKEQGHVTMGLGSYEGLSDHQNIFNSPETASKDHTGFIL